MRKVLFILIVALLLLAGCGASAHHMMPFHNHHGEDGMMRHGSHMMHNEQFDEENIPMMHGKMMHMPGQMGQMKGMMERHHSMQEGDNHHHMQDNWMQNMHAKQMEKGMPCFQGEIKE